MTRLMVAVFACFLAGCAAPRASSHAPAVGATSAAHTRAAEDGQIDLGRFSISLNVKDIASSRAFYEKLGFRAVGGDQAKNWLIMENQTSTIGLFQGMFDKNMLTYSPGWDWARATLPDFEDVREIQKELKSRGLVLKLAADESTTGPASLMLIDPDGNPILIDQYVPRPAR